MANLDYTIASGLRPIQLESPQNQLMQAYQLKGAQEASQMNAMKMQEMQRSTEQKNRLRSAVSGLDISSPEANKLIEQAYLQEGDLGGLMAHRKSMAEMGKEQLGQQKATSDLFDAKLKQSRQFLEGLDPNSPTAAVDFMKWHEANHADPVLGPILAARGVTANTSRARIDQAIKSGRLADLIDESKLGMEKFAQLSPAYKKAAEDQLSQDYSDYLAAGGNLTRSQFKETRNRQPATAATPAVRVAPVVAPVEPGTAALADVNAPVTAAPVSRVDANNVVVTTAPKQGIETINYGTYAPADVAAPAAAAPAAVVAPALGKRLELPGVHPEAAKLYSTRLPEDKIKADAIQRVHESQLKSEDKKSSLAQLQDERAALMAVNPKDPRIKQYNDAIRKETQWKPDDAPAISVAESSLISKAILEGRLDPAKVNSRNMKIIAGTLAMDPTANLKELNIDAVSGAAASKALATQSAKILTAANEADSMIKIVRNTSAKIDRSQYPNINAIQNAVSKGTGGKDIVALNTALNALVNSYARAINPTGVATVSDKNHAREIINSNYAAGQLDAILTVMEAEMNIAKASPGEAAAALKAGRNRPAAGAVDAAGRKPLGDILK